MCASSCARIASSCCGAIPASALAGSRTTGRSHPMTVGTSTTAGLQQTHRARDMKLSRQLRGRLSATLGQRATCRVGLHALNPQEPARDQPQRSRIIDAARSRPAACRQPVRSITDSATPLTDRQSSDVRSLGRRSPGAVRGDRHQEPSTLTPRRRRPSRGNRIERRSLDPSSARQRLHRRHHRHVSISDRPIVATTYRTSAALRATRGAQRR